MKLKEVVEQSANSTSSKVGGIDISKMMFSDSEIQFEIQRIRDNPLQFLPPQIPSAPLYNPVQSMERRVRSIQRYICQLEYNHTGQSFFCVRRDRGMMHLVQTAKTIIREALPIQCVEAVFLAVHLTNGYEKLLRIPVSFRTSSEGVEHCHIILAICYQKSKKWGALGISRLGNLMYKPFVHQTLHDLVSNFIASYEKYFHKNVEISLGLPFTHNHISETPLQWKVMVLKLNVDYKKIVADSHDDKDGHNSVSDTYKKIEWKDHKDTFVQFSKDCTAIYDYLDHTGTLPLWCDKNYRQGCVTLTSRR